MQIEVRTEGGLEEPKVIILADSLDSEVAALIEKISVCMDKPLVGFCENYIEIFKVDDVCRFYAANGKIFAETMTGEYILNIDENKLHAMTVKNRFLHTSKHEIVNAEKIVRLFFRYTGGIRMCLKNGSIIFVSPDCESDVKKYFGL